MNNINHPISQPSDIRENETLRDYSIRKDVECQALEKETEYLRQRIASIQDDARLIVMKTDDEQIIKACEQVLTA